MRAPTPTAPWIRDAAIRRVRSGVTRAEVAEDLGVSATAVAKWVQSAPPPAPTSPEESFRLGVRVRWLEIELRRWERVTAGAVEALTQQLGAGSAEAPSTPTPQPPLSQPGTGENS